MAAHGDGLGPRRLCQPGSEEPTMSTRIILPKRARLPQLNSAQAVLRPEPLLSLPPTQSRGYQAGESKSSSELGTVSSALSTQAQGTMILRLDLYVSNSTFVNL